MSGCRRPRPLSDRADDSRRVLADRRRRPPPDGLGGGGSSAPRLCGLEYRLSRGRPARRRLSRNLPRRMCGRGIARRCAPRIRPRHHAMWSPSGIPPAVIWRCGWPAGSDCRRRARCGRHFSLRIAAVVSLGGLARPRARDAGRERLRDRGQRDAGGRPLSEHRCRGSRRSASANISSTASTTGSSRPRSPVDYQRRMRLRATGQIDWVPRPAISS